MNNEQIQEYLSALSNDQLFVEMDKAYDDCMKAADEEANSEWHQACFAGLMTYAYEAQKRGLRRVPLP